jgi:hypothetical protein
LAICDRAISAPHFDRQTAGDGFALFRGGLRWNADLTDQQIMALDGHKTRDMLTVYAARNRKQRIQGMEKRRVARTK